MTNRQQSYLRISDYQSWTAGIYLIDAPCGSGKSSFVMNVLYPYVHAGGKRMILFSNRRALLEQQRRQTQGTDATCMICQKLEYNFNHGREAIEWVERNFDYIIIDEAHYLFQDALFNRNTEIMLDMVEQLQESKVIVLMSATAGLLKKYFVGKIKKTYHVSADYSYIKTVYCYTTPDSVNKILNEVPPGEKVVMFGDNKKRLRTLHREYPDSEYLNSGNKDESLAFRQITQNECFGCQMLFTTKVLDNGVNLKDKAIKHIIIEQTDMVEFIQCLGRKRVQSPDDTITLYFLSSVCSIAGRYKELKRDLAIVQQYLNARASGYEQEFWKINRTEYIPLMFDNSQHLVKPAYYKALSDCAFYRDILDKKASLVQQVRESLKLPIIPYERVSKDYKLNYYLSQNVGRKYFKDDRNELIEKINLRQDGHIKSSFKLLYQCLMESNVDFTLKSGIDNRKVYWTIEPK